MSDLIHRVRPFATTNILSILALALGVLTIALSIVGPLPDSRLLLIIVTMLSGFILTELLERYHLVEKVDTLTESLVSHGLDQLLFERMSANDAEKTLHSLLITSKRSVHWAAPEPRRGLRDDTNREYEPAVTLVARNGQVHLSWITRIDGAARAVRAKRLVFSDLPMPKTFVGSLDDQGKLPAFTVVISDERRMLVRIPQGRNEAGRGDWLFTASRPVVEIFLAYFDGLIEQSYQLSANKETKEMLSALLSPESQRETQ